MLTWKRSQEVLWRIVLDDVVLLPARGSDEPVALAGGSALWDLLEQPQSLAELLESLDGGHTSPVDRLAALESLLTRLQRDGVVESFTRP